MTGRCSNLTDSIRPKHRMRYCPPVVVYSVRSLDVVCSVGRWIVGSFHASFRHRFVGLVCWASGTLPRTLRLCETAIEAYLCCDQFCCFNKHIRILGYFSCGKHYPTTEFRGAFLVPAFRIWTGHVFEAARPMSNNSFTNINFEAYRIINYTIIGRHSFSLTGKVFVRIEICKYIHVNNTS